MTAKEYKQKLKAYLRDKKAEALEQKLRNLDSDSMRFGLVGYIEALDWTIRILDRIDSGVEK